jgi:hypothetical protein
MGLTTVNPYAPVIIGSVANAFNIVPFVASIPIVVGNDAYLGTAYGIWKCFVGHLTVLADAEHVDHHHPRGRFRRDCMRHRDSSLTTSKIALLTKVTTVLSTF